MYCIKSIKKFFINKKVIKFINCVIPYIFIIHIFIMGLGIFRPKVTIYASRDDDRIIEMEKKSENNKFQLKKLSEGIIWIESLLTIDTNEYNNQNEVKMEINSLNEKVNQQKTYLEQILLTRSSERSQSRLSFIALILLFVSLFSKKKDHQLGIICIALLFFLSFYFFDIHITDLNSRLKHNYGCYTETAKKINEIKINDTHKYIIDTGKIDTWEIDKRKNTMQRKFNNYLHPDISQIAFYLMPITIILGLFVFSNTNIHK